MFKLVSKTDKKLFETLENFTLELQIFLHNVGKINFSNNSEIINTHFCLKNVYKYFTWHKFSAIQNETFSKTINEFRSVYEEKIKEFNDLIIKLDKEILDEKIIYIKNNSSIEDQLIQIHSLSKFAKIENNFNNESSIVFDYNVLKVDILSSKYSNLIKIINNNYLEKNIELKIKHVILKETTNINIFCDLITNNNSSNNQSIISTFKPKQ